MLDKETYDTLPDAAKAAFVAEGDTYVPVKDASLKQKLDEVYSKQNATAKELEEYRRKEQERISEAEQRAYEKAKKEGNLDEVEKRISEKHAHELKQRDETIAQFNERMKKLSERQKKGIVAGLSGRATDKGRAAFKLLAENFVEVNAETDEVTFLDESGRATSFNEDRWFVEVVMKSDLFAPLVQANIATTGGGNAQGSGGGRATQRKFNEYSGAELAALRKQDPAAYERLRSEFYS